MRDRGPLSRVWIALIVAFAAAAAVTAAVARLTVFDLHAEDDARSRMRLVDGHTQIEVDPREPWALIPHILPGPADAWAGGTQHSLVLPLGPRPHRSLVLYLFLGNASRTTLPAWQDRHQAVLGPATPGGPRQLAVSVNDAILAVVEVPDDPERHSGTLTNGVIRRKVEIPAKALGNASSVRLSLVNQSGTTVVLERMRLVEGRPTFAPAHLGRRGRFPPESALLLGASLGVLLLWGGVEATGRPGVRRVLCVSAPALALLLLGVAELMPVDWSLTTAVPRWTWLALPWVLLLACRPLRGAPLDATSAPGSSRRVEPASTVLRRAAFILVYLLGVVLCLEGVSRGILSTAGLRLRLANYDQDAWWRLQWIERKGGEIAIFYSFDEYHPARGWALRSNVRNADDFDGVVVNSNAMGVRGRREYAPHSPPGVTRVLAFGDSFTFGDEVSDDETYASQLERILPRTEVINLGVHGYAHDQMLLYLREVGADYHPDLVLLGFVARDMERNLRSFRDFAKPRFELVGTHLVLGNVPVPRPEEVLSRERYQSRFVDLLSLLSDEVRSPSPASEREERNRLTAAILDEFQRTVVQMGATPVFAYLPMEGELGQQTTAPTLDEDFFLHYCRDRGIMAVDLRPTFLSRLGEDPHFMPKGHWDPREHRLAAEVIAAALVQQRLVPRPAMVGVPEVGRPPAHREASSS